jgi:hypothetical protein
MLGGAYPTPTVAIRRVSIVVREILRQKLKLPGWVDSRLEAQVMFSLTHVFSALMATLTLTRHCAVPKNSAVLLS